jgi:uncharacterized protein
MSSQLHILQQTPSPPLAPKGVPPWYHLLPGDPPLVFLTNRSQLFEADAEWFRLLSANHAVAIEELRMKNGFASKGDLHEELGGLNALSLNVAQACNLSCTYCYADQGKFGGTVSMMDARTASMVVNDFLASAPGPRPTIGFIGGEPLLNRPAIRAAVDTALKKGRERQLNPGFSITTNGTLITPEDLDFFRELKFSLSVSLDGGAEINDRHRITPQGRGSAAKVIQALSPLLEDPGPCKVSARVTIARGQLQILPRIEALSAVGFNEIGVSPLRTSPDSSLVLHESDWPVFLDEMIRVAEVERSRLTQGMPFRFSNLASAIKQIHRGYAKPLPCGSAVNYVSANASGNYYTCHRTLDDPRFYLGSAHSGISSDARRRFLQGRLVDSQEPCRTCWARYLCGGACHAEVIAAGRSGCDYVRGWLEYCLRFYYWMIKHTAGQGLLQESSHGA